MRVAVIAIGLIVLALVGYFIVSSAVQDGQFDFSKLAGITFPWEKDDAEGTVTEPTDGETGPAPSQDQTTGIIPPTFDIVRVDPNGSAVVAGRAQPGSTVKLFANGEVLAEEAADNRGEWVMIVDTPLDEGDQNLTLEMTLPDGTVLKSEQVVVVTVPTRPGLKPLVVLGDEDGTSKILQEPSGVRVGDLSLDIVDYDGSGAVILQGRSRKDSLIRAYVDNRRIGDTRADEKGNWEMTPDQSIPPGTYTLRVDQLGDDGSVTARVEVPFERAHPDAVANLNPGQVVVQPGNSLWRISRRLYGRGVLYTVIYEANKSQIRNPDLIYPGQIFETPSSAQE